MKWKIQEKDFYPAAFMLWPFIACVFSIILVVIIGAICALAGNGSSGFILLQAIFMGALFIYKKYWFLMLPFAILTRFLSSDGRMLLTFFLPLLFGAVLSLQVEGTILSLTFYLTFGVGIIYMFLFIWFFSFLKKHGWLISEVNGKTGK